MAASKRFFSGRPLRTALFWLLFLIINWALGRIYIYKEMGSSRTGLVERQFDQRRAQVKVLALGDSHMATGFDPRLVPRSFNFALFGENYIYNYYRLKYILARHPRIRTILLPADLHSFSSWRAERSPRDFYWVKYVDYLELGRLSGEPLGCLGRYVRGRLFPYLGGFAAILGLAGQEGAVARTELPEIVRGFVVRTGAFDQRREGQAAGRARLHFEDQRAFDQLVGLYFRKMLDLCASRGKTLVLVKFPLSEPYFRHAGRRISIARFDQRLDEMIAPYVNVKLLDFRQIFFDRDRELFADPDHLNAAGAQILTLAIKKELDR